MRTILTFVNASGEWEVTIDRNSITFKLSDGGKEEQREYKFPDYADRVEYNGSDVYLREYVYVYLDDYTYHVYKMQDDRCLIGDAYDANDNHIEPVAMHEFGEDWNDEDEEINEWSEPADSDSLEAHFNYSEPLDETVTETGIEIMQDGWNLPEKEQYVVCCRDGVAYAKNINRYIKLVYPTMAELTDKDRKRVRAYRGLASDENVTLGDVMMLLGDVIQVEEIHKFN
jgi:hypothetical protein